MGRLIDADRLIEVLSAFDDGIVKGCICVIKSQPTAYDLDKVTDKLSNISSADADYTLAEDLVDRNEVLKIVLCNKETK